jgi:hypothetical protein
LRSREKRKGERKSISGSSLHSKGASTASTSTTSDPELESGEEVVYPRSGPYPFEYPGKYLRVYSCEDGAEERDDERSESEDGTPRVGEPAFLRSVAVYLFPRSVAEYHVRAKSEDAPPTGLGAGTVGRCRNTRREVRRMGIT